MACTITTCQAIFHGKCLNADESEFEALRALRKNWVCPKCEKARKNIQPTDKCLSPPRSAPQQQTVDSTSQLLLAAIKSLTEEVKGLKFSLDANANEDSLSELSTQIQQHPSILPIDFDVTEAGKLVLNLPPPLFEPDFITSPNTEVDDQRVPVAKLSQSSSGEPNSPPVCIFI
ncbi:unnamed protein product [Nezara viridula]|uniref:PHD-type domain-containing protein n=1 Tax=Nezara viridula TaxID=85310 RepID=A0A9P0E9V6_NEZVI|nr:unnamed protein product [Nezara viridula]